MIKKITIKSDSTIIQAMKVLEEAVVKCLLVIDNKNRLLGTLTDGDLRRIILSGARFSENIKNAYQVNPIILKKDQFLIEEAKKLLLNKKLDLIPIVDLENKIIDIFTLSNGEYSSEKSNNLEEVPIVVMAGGKGARMAPVTKILPKPLIPINEKPIIEHIIERFTDYGCINFFFTVNYKAKILKAYFEELNPVYNVSFVDENKPLGTAGSLQYLKTELKKPFFVTNCDILIKTDYSDLYSFHNNEKNDITLVASTKEHTIPYGTCELNSDGFLSKINEKPTYDFLINTGLYVLNPKVINLIPENKLYHITHLISDAIQQDLKVGVFPIHDDEWIDIGQWTEYKKIIEKY